MPWKTLCSAFVLSSCLTTASPAPSTRPTSDPQPDVRADAVERRVHDRVAEVRRERRLKPYRWREDLARTARGHSRDMTSRDYFAHVTPEGDTPTDRASSNGIECRTRTSSGQMMVGVSENLFQSWLYSGYKTWTQDGLSWRTYDWRTTDDLAREAVEGWLESRSHREALLDPDTSAHGIGVAVGDDGEVMVTQLMC